MHLPHTNLGMARCILDKRHLFPKALLVTRQTQSLLPLSSSEALHVNWCLEKRAHFQLWQMPYFAFHLWWSGHSKDAACWHFSFAGVSPSWKDTIWGIHGQLYICPEFEFGTALLSFDCGDQISEKRPWWRKTERPIAKHRGYFITGKLLINAQQRILATLCGTVWDFSLNLQLY